MKSLLLKVAVGLVLAVVASRSLRADPAEAQETASRMAKKLVSSGFAMSPTDHSGVIGSGIATEFLIPVNKGLEYAFLVGTDKAAHSISLHVYDDAGGARPSRFAHC